MIYGKLFFNYNHEWRMSRTCIFLAIQICFSFLLSLFLSILIIIEKYIVVKYQLKLQNFSYTNVISFVFILIGICLILSIIPYLINKV